MKQLYESYDTFIFDIDGTVYHQWPVRIEMARLLIIDILKNPSHLRMLLALLTFRRIRDSKKYMECSIHKHIQMAASKRKIESAKLETYINTWMFERPLSLIAKNSNIQIVDFIRKCKKGRKKIIIYSDYPVEKKLEVLKIPYDKIFYPGCGIPNVLKPSRMAMVNILKALEMEYGSLRIIYIGDRDEKDGESANMVGIPYLNVHRLSCT